MTTTSQHAEWLSLIDISGPFLAEPVLKEVFPQGLEEIESSKRRTLRQAYDEWRDAQEIDDPDLPALHAAWVDLVLGQGLELDEDGTGDVFKTQADLPDSIRCDIPERGVTLRPDYAVVNDQKADEPLMFVSVYEPSTALDEPLKIDGWPASPSERMIELCRANGVRLGLVTNGERWMLVDAPVGAVTSFASWYANLWGQEPKTLQAFVNLLGVRRFFVDRSEQLPALLDESLKLQDEVTDALGEQVRRAVEVLIQRLDRADLDLNRTLLEGVTPTELYESALTVMMRTVFLLSAEERGLLLMGDERYEANYAVSTLRMQLRGEAEEILERRQDAWSRLLAIFRVVYGGIDHEAMRLPALGGSLFDPDRFPFLEGRLKGSCWKTDPARPLPIDNRTVLLLLDAVQLFQGRALSYRALDVEQIGYVYEGLLERTVVRAKDVTLDLDATKSAKKPWVTLDELEEAAAKSDAAVADLLKERTGSAASRVSNDLSKKVDEAEADKLLTACHGDQGLRDRIRPYFHLLRSDSWGYPLVYPVGTLMVTTGADRRETGTHYTPKVLTEAIVRETLEPIVYVGPAEGRPKEEWVLKSPRELLDLKLCDPAMGSGAFLVQACRWLSERLVEAWSLSEASGNAITSEGVVVEKRNGYEPLRDDPEERLLSARRLIAERCLYGVDMNPLAVELAKLSIWLVTLAKGRPFGFLDHNLRPGDSLLGINNLDQLRYLEMKPGKGSSKKLFAAKIDQAVAYAISLRTELRSSPIRDIRDVEAMLNLDAEAREKLTLPGLIADALIAEFLASGGGGSRITSLSIEAGRVIDGDINAVIGLRHRANEGLRTDQPHRGVERRPFHWPLEFPEVFVRDSSGFDAIVGNPPYMGGRLISGSFGDAYLDYLLLKSGSSVGQADIAAHFIRTAYSVCRMNGVIGFVTTNTISQGDTEKLGLAYAADNDAQIVNARKDLVWPGRAAVHVSVFVMYKGRYLGEKYLNGEVVDHITSRLDAKSSEYSRKEIKKNKGLASKGFDIGGDGFIFSSDDYKKFCIDFPNESEIFRPHINGKEIYSKVEITADRYAINFFDWPIEKAQKYENALNHLEKTVKPYRDTVKRKSTREKWWIYNENRPGICAKVSGLNRVLVKVLTSNTWAFVFLPSNYNFDQALIVFAMERYSEFAVLQSSIHEAWAKWNPSTMKADSRYTIGSCFTTFPFPKLDAMQELERVGESYESERERIRLEKKIGLTKFYGLVNDKDSVDVDIVKFRDSVKHLDNAVIDSYGWSDIELNHGFYRVDFLPKGKNEVFTISEAARSAVLERLTRLNNEHFNSGGADELRPKRNSSAVVSSSTAPSTGDLFHKQEQEG